MAKKLKATAKSPANIAFIKYWGKKNEKLRIPSNNSLSMCIDKANTITTVEFKKNQKKDYIKIDGKTAQGRERKRVVKHLQRIRKKANLSLKAKVISKNSFPKATGLASSASGMAALTLAASTAVGLNLSEKDLSKLARLASGSACRSIPGGFVEWQKGTNQENSFAVQLYPSEYWKIADVAVIVSKKMKKTSSTSGHRLAKTSPFYKIRLKNLPKNITAIKKAIKNKNFSLFGNILEKEALNFHAICLTSNPPLLYWSPTSLLIMKKIQNWRREGKTESYFTLDAGTTIHAITRQKDEQKLAERLKNIKDVKKVVINHPSNGARIIKNHLF